MPYGSVNCLGPRNRARRFSRAYSQHMAGQRDSEFARKGFLIHSALGGLAESQFVAHVEPDGGGQSHVLIELPAAFVKFDQEAIIAVFDRSASVCVVVGS